MMYVSQIILYTLNLYSGMCHISIKLKEKNCCYICFSEFLSFL